MNLARLAHLLTRRRWLVIGCWIAMTLVGAVAATKVSHRWLQSFSVPGKPAYAAGERTLKAFGAGARGPSVVVFRTSGDATTSPAIARAMKRAAATMPGALTSSYFSTHNQMYVSRDRHTTFMNVYPTGPRALGEGEWHPAQLEPPKGPYQWQDWSFEWEANDVGRHTLRARATDADGNVQPEVPPWNRLGYGNNAIEVVRVEVR